MSKTAADCASMADIRTEIDRLDEALMRLFAERWTYIGRAAEIKRGTDIPADVPARVTEVRENVRAHAQTLGLDPAFYDRFWAGLIQHAIEHEERLLRTSRA